MRVTVNPVLDMDTLKWVSNDGVYDYVGPVITFCCGGDPTQEALEKSQAAMTDTLNADYSQSFSEQQGILARQGAVLQQVMANPMGYTPQQLATATTSINENTATAARQAIGAAAAYAATHGGADVGSGAAGQIAGEIGSAAAQSKAGQLAALSNSNQEMKQRNFWNAISGLNSVGSEYGGAGGTAIGASAPIANSSVNAGELDFQHTQSGWQDFGAVVGGIGGLLTGGALTESLKGGGGGGIEPDAQVAANPLPF